MMEMIGRWLCRRGYHRNVWLGFPYCTRCGKGKPRGINVSA